MRLKNFTKHQQLSKTALLQSIITRFRLFINAQVTIGSRNPTNNDTLLNLKDGLEVIFQSIFLLFRVGLASTNNSEVLSDYIKSMPFKSCKNININITSTKKD